MTVPKSASTNATVASSPDGTQVPIAAIAAGAREAKLAALLALALGVSALTTGFAIWSLSGRGMLICYAQGMESQRPVSLDSESR